MPVGPTAGWAEGGAHPVEPSDPPHHPENQGYNADIRHLAPKSKIGLLILKSFAKPGRMQRGSVLT